ncbi:MAG: SMP-30/gluconolactonase/LRE family protein [Pseudomonadota bacterium]
MIREVARLPDALRHSGPPTPWAEMTRPGGDLRSFLEAPIWDGRDLILCDVAAGRVLRLAEGGDWSIEHEGGAPHAMRLHRGRRIVADYWDGLIDLDAGPIRGPDEGLLGLSDMAEGPDDALWITESGRTSLADPRGRVWRWDGAWRLAAEGLAYPNGVALGPDGAVAYVACTRANAVLRFSTTLPDDGLPMLGVFLHLSGGLGPDGLVVAPDGRLAVAQAQAGRAYVFDVLGDPLATMRLPEGRWTTSVTFDPDDPDRLLIVEAERAAIWEARLEGPC